AGNAYFAGYTTSTDLPTASPFQAASAGGTDAFVAKLNAAGTALVYATYLGGSGGDLALGIALDGSNAVVAGRTTSANFPTLNAVQATYAGGGSDAFVARLNSSGQALTFATYLGGSGSDLAEGVAVNASGVLGVTGLTQSSDFPTAAPLQSSLAGT